MNIQEQIVEKIKAMRIGNKDEYEILPNPDFIHRKQIEEAIKNNDGYCCCAIEKIPETRCMCKDFKEQNHAGFCHCGRYYKVKKYPIVTLCGSTKFKDEFLEVQKKLTLEGYIVLSVGLFGHSGDSEVWEEGTKEKLDEMHKAKIEMSDMIFVINPNGYIGESTRNEIEWARELNKKIKYLEP